MPRLVEIGPVVLVKKILKFRQYIFAISEISPPGYGLCTSFEHLESTLESLSLKNALCQVWINWPNGSADVFFFNFVNVFLLFRNHLPLEKGVALNLNKHESSLPKDVLC